MRNALVIAHPPRQPDDALPDGCRIDRRDCVRPLGPEFDHALMHDFDAFCVEVLRPAYHEAQAGPNARGREWASYRTVNGAYASLAAERADVASVVTIHGYELQLVPAMLRSSRPDLHIEFYLDIPFPGPRAFEKLPWSTELIGGLMAAHLIGVQSPADATALRSAAVAAGGCHSGPTSIRDSPRIDISPTSVDVALWERLALLPATARDASDVRRRLGSPPKILLGLGDLDDAAGTDVRLEALELLLRSGRVQGTDVRMIEIVRPAMRESDSARRRRRRIEATVARINGDFGRLGSPVVHYLHRHLDPRRRCVLNLSADVMLATPLHHGANAPALEFVASRIADVGAVIVSEFSQCAPSMSHAVLVNPFDPEALSSAIYTTIQMDSVEQARRMSLLRCGLRTGSRGPVDIGARCAPSVAMPVAARS